MNLIERIPARGRIVYLHDIVMAALSYVVTLYLRLGDGLLFYSPETLVQGGIMFTAVCAVAFWIMGLYRGVWRYASLNDLVAITKAVSLAIVVSLVVMFLWTRLEHFPRSLVIINWFVLIGLLGAPRFLFRLLKDRRIELRLENPDQPRVPVLLAGAGDGAELFIRALARSEHDNYRVVGILSETAARVGRRILGHEVLGTLDDIALVTAELRARGNAPMRLILTKDDLDGARMRDLVERAGTLGMTMARTPKLTDFRSGAVDSVTVRPVDIEDLLGRPQAVLDRHAMRRLIQGCRVLITGAGGSIGAELVRQISDLEPARVLLLDQSEFALYGIDLELAARHPALARGAVIADVRDARGLDALFAAFRPELVFHAAALKHVPLVELNPLAGLATNVLGTVNVAEACRAHAVATMVQISTDKAVNPTNVMGASKRLAEQYCQALDGLRENGGGQGESLTRFVTVRFGNVLGSTGSVVPLFQKQLAAGGPLTITHPDMKRYFMTIREAVELVLQASALHAGPGMPKGGAKGGAKGRIMVLDMGEPVRILDLARQMIRLAGLKPETDIAIEFIGRRPGEKLFEEVFHGAEKLQPAGAPGILLAAPRAADLADLTQAMAALRGHVDAGDTAAALALLGRLVPDYIPDQEPRGPAPASAPISDHQE